MASLHAHVHVHVQRVRECDNSGSWICVQCGIAKPVSPLRYQRTHYVRVMKIQDGAASPKSGYRDANASHHVYLHLSPAQRARHCRLSMVWQDIAAGLAAVDRVLFVRILGFRSVAAAE